MKPSSRSKFPNIPWPEPREVRRFIGMARDQFDFRSTVNNVSVDSFKSWFSSLQTAPRQFTVPVREFATAVAKLMGTAVDSGKLGAQNDRDVKWKAGWYYALSSTERDMFENCSAAVLEALHTVETEGYDCPIAGSVILTDLQHSEVLTAITSAVSQLEKLRDTVVTSRYRHGSFEVIQSSRVSPDLALRMLRRLDLMVAALKEFGCGHLLYGRLLMNDNIGEAKWTGRGATRTKTWTTAAHYVKEPDEIQIGQHVTSGRPDFSTAALVHEMGHRHWYQAMTERDREAFTEAVTLPGGRFISPTAYGQTNIRETFAEWFMVYASGYRGPEVDIVGIEAREEMSRSRFRALCKLDKDDKLEDYIPGFAKDSVLEELSRLEPDVLRYLVSIMEVPEFTPVREIVNEADGLVDAGLIRRAESYAFGLVPMLLENADGKYPKLVERFREITNTLRQRGLIDGVINAAIRIYCSKSVSSGKWPEVDPKLLVSREDMETEFRKDLGGDDEFEKEDGHIEFDLRKHRLNIKEKGITHHGDLTLKVVPHSSGEGFTIERTKAGEKFVYPDPMSLDRTQQFALAELRRLLAVASGASTPTPVGITNPEVADLSAKVLSSITGLEEVLRCFPGPVDGVTPTPASRLVFWNQKTSDLRLTGSKEVEHRYFRAKQKGAARWEGEAFTLKVGDVVYTQADPGLVFYVVKTAFNPEAAQMSSFILYLSRIGVAWSTAGGMYSGRPAGMGQPAKKDKPAAPAPKSTGKVDDDGFEFES